MLKEFFFHNPHLKSTTQMTANLQQAGAQKGWDASQLSSAVNRSLGPERTLDIFKDLTSYKNYAEVVRRLSREDAAKLVDNFDQVCYIGLRDALSRLTTTAMTRLSDPSIGGRLKIRRC